MKRILVLMLLVCGVQLVEAQVKIPSTSSGKAFTMPPAIGDLDKTSNDVTNQLTSKLGLDSKQKTGTFDAVKGFLEEKSSILGLAKTDQAGYLSKFGGMQNGLFGKLKGIMGVTKYASFLKLKPTGNGAGNVLSNLFF
jgi:hypothetical protein